MESYDTWNSRIAAAASRLGFSEGYKILYVPWETLGRSDTVFLSLNPGRPPHGAVLDTLTDERGNSYEVERTTTASPITAQFLALSELIKLKPRDILTGTVAPFRSNRWKTLPSGQRNAALALGREFWRQAFSLRRPKTVIACCSEAAIVANDLLGGKAELTIASGWGDTSLRRYRAPDGAVIVEIPHLSTFKLLSCPECREPLRTILELS
ncbi:MAG: hypothetical protein ACK4IU_16795 [Tabrizicola flagellatus]|uniref:hypothetical protein n=1 Tax=Tabrizicola flagellatus TaxID=2593021 RepID=UPI003919281A